jgi:hypothetical protein
MILIIVFLAAAALSNLATALADPCALQLGYPIMPTYYTNSAVSVIVPLSTVCSTQFGSQLFAAGTAFDLTTNTNAASVNTILTTVNGGYAFNGQLGFNLPPSTQGHWLQVSVTVYSNQNGNELTTNGEAFQVNTGTQQVVTTTLTQQLLTQLSPPLGGGSGRPRFVILGYVAIAAILATVIIVTVALVVYSRGQPSYYPVQPRGGY